MLGAIILGVRGLFGPMTCWTPLKTSHYYFLFSFIFTFLPSFPGGRSFPCDATPALTTKWQWGINFVKPNSPIKLLFFFIILVLECFITRIQHLALNTQKKKLFYLCCIYMYIHIRHKRWRHQHQILFVCLFVCFFLKWREKRSGGKM